MKETRDFFKKNNTGWLATTENNVPKNRPVMLYADEKSGRFYFGTQKVGNIFKQLSENPVAEFGVLSQESVIGRIKGKVTFSDNDLELKQSILDSSPMIKEIYKTADNPAWQMFYFSDGEVYTHDIMNGKSPKVIEIK